MHEHKQNQCKRKAKHRKNAMKLIYKEKADSEDGYLGMYLFLMGKYLEKTESTDLPEYWKKGISLALKKIQSLMQDWKYFIPMMTNPSSFLQGYMV